MKKLHWLGISMLVAVLSTGATAAPERIGDFALLDSEGVFHQFSRYRHKDALVLMSYADNCGAMDAAVTQFKQLQEDWAPNGVAFALISSAPGVDRATARSFKAAGNTGLPVLLDESQLVSETLQISSAGEVLVLDPERLTVLYRGPVHEHVGTTLTGLAAGTTLETMVMPASGCAIDYPARQINAEAAPDYSTEVAPIIADSCAECHRKGGIGPFAMDSHLMLKGWSPMIRETLLTKRMPPTQVDPYIGHFSNARYIDDSELQTLVHWIDAGSPRGAGPDPLTSLEFKSLDEWEFGEPDYIVSAPKHEVPATGVLDYLNVDVELPFNEDKWVRAVQFIPGDTSVLHHLLTYVTAPAEDFDGGEADTRSIARRFLEGYAPGKIDAMEFPTDTGVYIPAGHKLSMQFHYTTNGRATTDETILGLYMYDEPPSYENFTRSVSARFAIPPHAIDHKAHAEYVFEEDVVVTGLRAHMHFRGRDMKFSVETPDGGMRDLLSVPAYSYAWQPTYALEEPEFIPAGTRVHVTGAFDNSQYNPANPDPSKEITFGLQSWDEMFIGYWTYHAAAPRN
ncbi:MAG: hypothetical protein WDZ76_02460 [Pseudohongiellaceae bacterium]